MQTILNKNGEYECGTFLIEKSEIPTNAKCYNCLDIDVLVMGGLIQYFIDNKIRTSETVGNWSDVLDCLNRGEIIEAQLQLLFSHVFGYIKTVIVRFYSSFGNKSDYIQWVKEAYTEPIYYKERGFESKQGIGVVPTGFEYWFFKIPTFKEATERFNESFESNQKGYFDTLLKRWYIQHGLPTDVEPITTTKPFLSDAVIKELYNLVGKSLSDDSETWAKRFIDDGIKAKKIEIIAKKATAESNKLLLCALLGQLDTFNPIKGYGIKSFAEYAQMKFHISNWANEKSRNFTNTKNPHSQLETIKNILENAR